MTINEVLARTRAGGVAHAELTAERRGTGRVRFTGIVDFDRGLTTLEREEPADRPLWVELTGTEVGLTAGGEPEERVVLEEWAGRDIGRSGAGLLSLLDAVAGRAVPAGDEEIALDRPLAWACAVTRTVTGIPVRGRALRVAVAPDGRLACVEVLEQGRVRRRTAVTHALRLFDWRA